MEKIVEVEIEKNIEATAARIMEVPVRVRPEACQTDMVTCGMASQIKVVDKCFSHLGEEEAEGQPARPGIRRIS